MVGTTTEDFWDDECLITGIDILQPEDDRYPFVDNDGPKKPVLAFQLVHKKTNTVFYKKVPSSV